MSRIGPETGIRVNFICPSLSAQADSPISESVMSKLIAKRVRLVLCRIVLDILALVSSLGQRRAARACRIAGPRVGLG